MFDNGGEEAEALRNELETKASELESTRHELETVQADLELLQQDCAHASAELDDAHATLEARATTIQLQDDEIDYLRKALVEAEEAAESLGDGFLRRAKDAERELATSQSVLAELSSSLNERTRAVETAVLQAEMEKANATDAKSRLVAYLAEVDRLSLANATLKKEVEDAKRESADTEIKVVDLERKVERLQEDKELLNVAVESKQTELALLQRQLAQGQVTPRKTPGGPKPAPKSTAGRVVRANGLDVTPVPKRLTTSTSLAALRAAAGTIPPPPALQPSTKLPSTPTPLGASGRHNQSTNVQKALGPKKVVGAPSPLSKRTSLPVLQNSTMDLSKALASKIDENHEV